MTPTMGLTGYQDRAVLGSLSMACHGIHIGHYNSTITLTKFTVKNSQLHQIYPTVQCNTVVLHSITCLNSAGQAELHCPGQFLSVLTNDA